MGTTTHLEESILESFCERVRGPVLQPGDDGYNEARTVWNAKIDREPAVIVRCTGAADVMAAVDFAREYDLEVAVKSGGHHTAGHAVCDDGLVIALSAMNGVRVDPTNETVRVQGGATWAELKHELRPFGLEIVAAVNVDDVGVTGYTLGGGMGFNTRQRGLAIDNLRSVDVVTADGELVHASEDDNPELFWALRGGSGNFGVVTALEFECHPTDYRAVTGQFLYPIEELGSVLRFYRDYRVDLPEAVSVGVGVLPVDGDPHTFLGVTIMDESDPETAVFDPVRTFGEPIHQGVRSVTYRELGDEPVQPGRRTHMESLLFTELSDDAIDTFCEQAVPSFDPAYVTVFSLGGAVNRVAADVTAYPHRNAEHLLVLTPQWSDPADDNAIASWARTFREAMAPYSTGGEYVNNQTDDAAERVKAAYGDNYERLVKVKNEWDPENLFSVNQNIEPSI